MTAHVGRAARVPFSVSLFGPVLKFLIRLGVPVGPNGLITVPGRTTGQPRTAAVAVIKVGDRRWIWAPWGEVNWVQNLRAAGRATLTIRRRPEEVTAVELTPDERVAYFRDILGPKARSIPGGVTFIRLIDGVDVKKPIEAAEGRRVFELRSAG